MPDHLDLNFLRVFDMVMVERHVTRAAERLQLSQSAVSNSLNRLREIFKDPLFKRAPRGVEPTPKALAVWPDIHSALEQLQRTVQPQSFNPAQAENEFRVTMVDLAAALLTPYLFSTVSALAPKATLTLVPHDPQDTIDRFGQGAIDYAIAVEPPRLAVLDNRPLWSDRYIIAGRRNHPALKKPVTLDELCGMPQLAVSLSSGTHIGSPVDIALGQLGRSRRISLTVNQFLVATSVLRESNLVAVLPARLIAEASPSNSLDIQPLPIDVAPAMLYLIWHRRTNASAPVVWFRQQILDAVAKMNADFDAHEAAQHKK